MESLDPELSTMALLTFGAGSSLSWRQSCTLWDSWQHLWYPLTLYTAAAPLLLPAVTTQNVSIVKLFLGMESKPPPPLRILE